MCIRDSFDPDWTPNTTDAGTRRYRYAQQGEVGAWNFARLLESISPLMEEPKSLHEALDSYYESYGGTAVACGPRNSGSTGSRRGMRA